MYKERGFGRVERGNLMTGIGWLVNWLVSWLVGLPHLDVPSTNQLTNQLTNQPTTKPVGVNAQTRWAKSETRWIKSQTRWDLGASFR